jgi:hypothetical protein
VGWAELVAASKAFDAEAKRLAKPISGFEVDAYATSETFALVEDGAQELFASYRSFYQETCGYLSDLKGDLVEAATRLLATGKAYRDAEDGALESLGAKRP